MNYLASQTNNIPIVEFQNITKHFAGVKALEDVSLKIKKGEVHCVLGENGAGKSTLVKILTGVHRADSGDIFINGCKVEVGDIRTAQKLNIGTVFQENSLIPHLTVAENIFLTREIKNDIGLIDWNIMFKECVRWGNELGVNIDPRARINKLSVAEQQIIEIVKMFSRDPHIVILDEPTSALSDKEIENLFKIIKRMQKKGVTFIYISHRMEEIKTIGDSGTVLRDGKFITSISDVKKIETEEIISHIVGRPLNEQFPQRNVKIGDVVLEVKNLSVPKLLHNISFKLKKGEVLGFAGLMGSGRTETAKAIFGDLPRSSGKIFINGNKIDIKSPYDAIKNGISLLPENRKEEGLFLEKTVSWNTVFSALPKIKKRCFLDRKKEGRIVEGYRKQLRIKTPTINQFVKYLSGGNQQKVVFAKWLYAESYIYIFDEPTRGIDVGAKSEIYGIINDLVAQGNAVIVISSELPEILGICDRVAVFHEGHIANILGRDQATQESIMYYAIGGSENG